MKTNVQTKWKRTQRVTVFDAPREARYPSVTMAKDGSILVLFTRRNVDQIEVGSGELVIVRSTDEGNSWSDASVVHHSDHTEP